LALPVIAGADPIVSIRLGKVEYVPGDLVRIEVTAANAGPATVADLFVGALVPKQFGPRV